MAEATHSGLDIVYAVVLQGAANLHDPPYHTS